MAHELPYIAAIGEAIHLEMERTRRSSTSARTSPRPRTTRSCRRSAATACA